MYEEFAPKLMDENEIAAEIRDVLAGLGIEKPAAAQKGLIMKNLMPRVKGKAEGALVQKVLSGMMEA